MKQISEKFLIYKVTDGMIEVPTYLIILKNKQQKMKIAGLNVLRIINESI